MKLSFHPYVDHQKQSSDASWAQTGPDGRGRLELRLDWASGLAWTSLLPPKLVAKEEDVQGHLLDILHLLGACSNLGLGPMDV